jgi:hypothetical protein
MHEILDEIVKEHLEKKKSAKSKSQDDDDDDDTNNNNPGHDNSDNDTESSRDENFTLDAVDNYINKKVSDVYPLSTLRNPTIIDDRPFHLAPITVAHVKSRPNDSKVHKLVVLLDSGASATIVSYRQVRNLQLHRARRPSRWTTRAGTFTTKAICKIKFSLPEFFENRTIDWTEHVDDSKTDQRYDMIIGRDLLEELGMSLDFGQHIVTWDNATVTMKDSSTKTSY